MSAHGNRIRIRKFSKRDIPAVLALLKESLGDSFIDTAELIDYLDNPSKQALIATTYDGTIAGVGTMITASSPEVISEHLPLDMANEVSLKLPNLTGPVGLLKSVAVTPEFRGQGVAYLLGKARLRWLTVNGVKDVFSIAWEDDNGCHAEGILTKLGFTDQGSIENYWLNDSVENSYSCPTCGTECHCTARVFFKPRES